MMTVLAGLPWFTDWGRDTMIAFTGLTLCTKRFKEAEEILLTFARYIRHGIVPNMFPDDNMPPLYNTVDASLWYFYAVYQYLHYNPAAEAEAFVKEQIFPHLKEIISAYEKGTDFSIYMEDDGPDPRREADLTRSPGWTCVSVTGLPPRATENRWRSMRSGIMR